MAAGLNASPVVVDPDLGRALARPGRRWLVGVTGVLGIGGGWVLLRGLLREDVPMTTGTALALALACALASVSVAFSRSGDERGGGGDGAPADQGPGCVLLPQRRTPRLGLAGLLLSPALLLVLMGSTWSLLALPLAGLVAVRGAVVDTRVRLDPTGLTVRGWWPRSARSVRWEAVAAVSATGSVRPHLLVHTRDGEPPLRVDLLLQRWSPSVIAATLAHVAGQPHAQDALTDARSVPPRAVPG